MLEKQQPTRCKVTSDTLKTCVENRPEASEKGGCVQLTCTLANGVAWIHKCVSISLHLDTEMPVLFLPQERNAASAEARSLICTLPLFGELQHQTHSNICWLKKPDREVRPVPAVEYDGSLRGFQNCFTLAYTRRLLIYYTFGNRRAGLSCYTIGDINLMHWNMI